MRAFKTKPPKVIHPLWLRLCHWLNALAILIMVTSGWRIYNASPLFNFEFPDAITLGGWLGGALQWHFAAMWLFAANGLFYVIANIVTGRIKYKFWPLSIPTLFRELGLALRGKLSHDNLANYNMAQKFFYLGVVLVALFSLLSGLVVWKSVQFAILRELMGGYENARVIHFICMSLIVLFVVIHLIMVALVPKTLMAMIRGR